MISKVGILIVMLSSDGHWFGGSTETIFLQWAIMHGAPDVRVEWVLAAGRAAVAKGRVDLRGDAADGRASAADSPAGSAVAKVPVPKVRVPTGMVLRYRAAEPGGRLIEEGQAAVWVYPRNLLDSAAVRLRGRELYVWDEPAGLPDVFQKTNIRCTSFQDPQKLQFVRPDILIAAAGQVARRPDGAAKLINLAAAGTGVLVLRQADSPSLAGYPLVPRKSPLKLALLDDHPLLRHLGQWKMSSAETSWALQLPADDPVLPIAWWPGEFPAQPAKAVDALLASKTLGQGRIVFCQFPLGPWQSDPRSQLFLDDALDYLMSPVAPTPPLAANR